MTVRVHLRVPCGAQLPTGYGRTRDSSGPAPLATRLMAWISRKWAFLRRFPDEPVAEIVQCGEPHP